MVRHSAVASFIAPAIAAPAVANDEPPQTLIETILAVMSRPARPMPNFGFKWEDRTLAEAWCRKAWHARAKLTDGSVQQLRSFGALPRIAISAK